MMHTVQNPFSRRAVRHIAGCAGTLLAAMPLLTGCSSLVRMPWAADAPAIEHYNVHNSAVVLPADLKRVALLPLGADESCQDLIEGRVTLEPVLNSELLKTRKFEVVRASAEDLKNRTGQAMWTGEEVLPADFLGMLQETYGCDAVLFSRLTVFRPYRPIAVGWRLKLVNVRTGEILWAGDEVFDAGDEAMRDHARHYQRNLEPCALPDAGWALETSPRKFGEYSVAQLLGTLPAR